MGHPHGVVRTVRTAKGPNGVNYVQRGPATDMPNKFLRLSEVRALTALSRSSIYAYMGAGTFPAAINIGARSIAWLESEVQEWMEGRIVAHRKTIQSEGAINVAR
jgi:prophage regulatory protein